MRSIAQIMADLHWKHERLHDSQEHAEIARLEGAIAALNDELQKAKATTSQEKNDAL